MKHLRTLLTGLLLLSVTVHAQSNNTSSIPSGFSEGSLITSDNQTLNGYIKNNIRKNGEVILLTSEGLKKKFDASGLFEVKIEATVFPVVSGVFYKLVSDGSRIRLLRKASMGADKIEYNGSEPVLITSGEGGYDDYFIQQVGSKKVQLVKRKDFKKIFESICSDCSVLKEDIKSDKIGFEEIEQAVMLYNKCDK